MPDLRNAGVKIIVFGPDNSGKTTLCNTLASMLNIKHQRSLGPATKEEQEKFMDEKLCSNESLVFDRFPGIEEVVCGQVLRGKSNFDLEELEIYLGKATMFIHCNSNIERVKDWGEREQMDGVKENIEALHEGYCEVSKSLQECGYDVREYDYTKAFEYKKEDKEFKNSIPGILRDIDERFKRCD